MNKLGFNMKKVFAIMKLNSRALRKTIILCLIPAVLMLLEFTIQYVILYKIAGVKALGENEYMGFNNMLLLVPVMCAIFLASSNFFKTIRLNAKKKDYFLASIMVIAIFAFAVAMLTVVGHYAFEKPFSNEAGHNLFTLSLYGVFGFSKNFFLIGLLQMFGFVFFWSVFVFILVSLQDFWVGWAVDILIVACISVFSSIKFFRQNFWVPFFDATIFGHPALQICFTIFVGLALFSTYLLIIKRKKI